MKKINRIEFDNGLVLLTERRPNTKKAVLLIGVKVGSVDEPKKLNGVSHFNEHMLFKSNKYRTTEQIAEDLEYSGAVANAYTTFRYTAFYVKTLRKNIPDAIEILLQGVTNFDYREDEFLTEKEVILTELKNYLNSPEKYSLYEFFIPTLFRGTPLEKTIIGSERTIRNLKKRDLERFKKKFYIPGNMVIVAVGNFNEDIVKKEISKTFADLDEKKIPRINSRVDLRNKKIEKFRYRSDISQLYMCLGYRVPGYVNKDIHRLDLLSGILYEGFSSRMFRELREKRGIGYDVSGVFSPHGDEGIFSVYINGFDTNRFKEAKDAISRIFEDLKKNLVPKREFNGVKNLMISKHSDKLEKILDRAIMILETEIYGIPYDFRRKERFIREISRRELMETAKDHLTDDYSMTVLCPEGFRE